MKVWVRGKGERCLFGRRVWVTLLFVLFSFFSSLGLGFEKCFCFVFFLLCLLIFSFVLFFFYFFFAFSSFFYLISLFFLNFLPFHLFLSSFSNFLLLLLPSSSSFHHVSSLIALHLFISYLLFRSLFFHISSCSIPPSLLSFMHKQKGYTHTYKSDYVHQRTHTQRHRHTATATHKHAHGNTNTRRHYVHTVLTSEQT